MTTLLASFVILFSTVVVGLYIAYRLCNNTKLIVRLILLLPMLSAMFNLNMLLANDYTATTLGVVRELSTFVLYMLVALLLRGNRLLKNIDSICERKSTNVSNHN